MVYLVAGQGPRKPGSHRARELYSSTWFRAATEYVSRRMGVGNDRWFVLTPSQGLVRPGHVLSEAGASISNMTPSAKEQWLRVVLGQVRRTTKLSDPMVLFGSGAMIATLRKALTAAGFTVLTPLRTTPKATQIAWFRSQVTSDATQRSLEA